MPFTTMQRAYNLGRNIELACFTVKPGLKVTDIQPEVTIYSIVNSIIRGGSASKVQILVNGDSNLKYQDQVDLSQPLTEREDIVED